MQPDLVWIKSYSATGNHCWVDSVRGVNERLISNAVGPESTNTGTVNSFNSDGFTIGDSSLVNTNGTAYVAWCWKAGGAAVANNDGSIASTVSANPEAGFSIVNYTSTGSAGTVGHGLGKRPKVVLIKRRTGADTNWPMWFDGISTNNDDVLQLNLDNAKADAAVFFNSGNTTTTTFQLGSGGGQTNDSDGNSDTYIAYVWAEIEGFSKFGIYDGNGSTNGPYIHCGFKPAWIMTKRIDTSTNGDWTLFDIVRAGSINPVGEHIRVNDSNDELNFGTGIDILSNGFKMREAANALNNSSSQYVFMAFADTTQYNLYGASSNPR
jgi:hypothetical protein